jgi:CO dehydrogenase maturation factor
MSLTIAIAGKGGIGKTTLSAIFVRVLKERGIRPILAVDADPNSNLAEALGAEAARTLAEIREQYSSPEGAPAGGVGRVRAVEDEIQRAVAEGDGYDLVTMGRPEGPRCYCAVNNLLRTSLDHLSQNYAAVVLDNEAGMEHLSRRTTNNVDCLIAVLNPTEPSCRAVRRIVELARSLPVKIGKLAVLVNRMAPEGVPGEIAEQLAALGVERLPDVPQDAEVERANAIGRDVFSLAADGPAILAVRQVLGQLCAASAATPM